MSFNLVKRILLLNLIAQSGIILTGATVRLTGSGLGCPTWPQCTPGSFIPTLHQAESYHKYIEFGNRTLTGILTLAAIATLVGVWKTSSDKRFRKIALIPIVGTIFQAILGGITVLTNLNSATVMIHLLVSVALVAVSVYLFDAYNRSFKKVSGVSRAIGIGVLASAALVVFLGSVVTNSGPHSGDANVASALPFDPALMAWLHADSVWLFVGVLIASWLLLKAGVVSESAFPSLRNLTALTVVQGVVGYSQYFSGLPILLVGIHVLLAILIWISAVYFYRRSNFELKSEINAESLNYSI
jgi:cytochrome c oxidase assembly protein subunit 15